MLGKTYVSADRPFNFKFNVQVASKPGYEFFRFVKYPSELMVLALSLVRLTLLLIPLPYILLVGQTMALTQNLALL
jgi:hypothetical protein